MQAEHRTSPTLGPAATARPAGGTYRLLTLSAVLIVAALCGVAAAIWQLRRDALEDAQRDSANLALVLAQQTNHAVQAIDIVLQQIVRDVKLLDTNTAGVFERVVGGGLEYARLHNQLSQLPQAEAITVVDKDGFVINTTRVFPARRLDLRDRDFYLHFRDSPSDEAFISEPVRNRTTNTWTLYVARRMSSGEGEFLGVVITAIALHSFDRLYQSMQLRRDEKLLLLRRDGLMLVSYPADLERIGRRFLPDSPWFGVVANGGGHYHSDRPFGGQDSLIAVAPVGAYPLVLNVMVAHDTVLETWRRQATVLGAGATVLLCCAMALMVAVHRRQRAVAMQNDRLVVVGEELRQSRERILVQTGEFQTTLENMDQGLFLIDANGRIAVHNRQTLVLLNLPGALLATRPLLADVLAHQWRVNGSGGGCGLDAFLRPRMDFRRAYTTHAERPDGRVLEIRNTPTPSGGAVRIFTDVTARTLAERRVRYFAQHDELTRLVNRSHFGERLSQAVMEARTQRSGLTVMYVDLDGFKGVNDSHGHGTGDGLLVEVAQRMQDAVRPDDTVARIGGDEFAVIMPGLRDGAVAALMAQQLIAIINEPCNVGGKTVTVSASIGIARFGTDGNTPEDLLHAADAALYEAKRTGKNRATFSHPDAEPAVSAG